MKNILLYGMLLCFFCNDVSSFRYNVRVMNFSGNAISLSKKGERDISIIRGFGDRYSFPKNLRLKDGEIVSLSVDASPYVLKESSMDAVEIQVGQESVMCSFKPVTGATYVYPFLDQERLGCKLGKDLYGTDFTLIFGDSQEAGGDISVDSLIQQGAEISFKDERSFVVPCEDLF